MIKLEIPENARGLYLQAVEAELKQVEERRDILLEQKRQLIGTVREMEPLNGLKKKRSGAYTTGIRVKNASVKIQDIIRQAKKPLTSNEIAHELVSREDITGKRKYMAVCRSVSSLVYQFTKAGILERVKEEDVFVYSIKS